MDPRIRIHTEMSWIRNTDCNYDLLQYKLTDLLELCWLTRWNYELSDLLQLLADCRAATMIYESWLTCCNYELTPIRSKKSEPIVITTANNNTVSWK
jgi:hypothetical protein